MRTERSPSVAKLAKALNDLSEAERLRGIAPAATPSDISPGRRIDFGEWKEVTLHKTSEGPRVRFAPTGAAERWADPEQIFAQAASISKP